MLTLAHKETPKSLDISIAKEILLVEDNPADVRLIEEFLKSGNSRNKLHIVVDGTDALEYLKKECGSPKGKCPNLILLDMNLPKKSGFEVLEEIKDDKNLCKIPVVVFSTSASKNNVSKCYALGANAYIRKPIDFNEFEHIMELIDELWLNITELP